MSERARAVRQAVNQLAFHRDQHHGWRRAAAWLVLGNVLTAAAFAGYVWLHSTVYIAVAATPDGRLVPLTPLDEPIMSDAALKHWTVSAVTEAFTLGHHDWRLRLSNVRESFTDAGYESFPPRARREPVPRPAARPPPGGLGGRAGCARHHRHALLPGPDRLGRRVPPSSSPSRPARAP